VLLLTGEFYRGERIWRQRRVSQRKSFDNPEAGP